MALRLGTVTPGYSYAPQPKCVCGTTVDIMCDHLFGCPHGNEWQTTHDAVAYEVKKLLDAAGCATTREPYHFYVDSKSRPDLVIRSGWVEGSATVHTADIAVAHPPLDSFFPRSADTQCAAADKGAHKKTYKYAHHNQAHGVARETIPFVFESFGAAATTTTAHIWMLSDRIYNSRPASRTLTRAAVHTFWVRRIVCTLVKAVADMISRRLVRAFTKGDRLPPNFVVRVGGFAPNPRGFAAIDAAYREFSA